MFKELKKKIVARKVKINILTFVVTLIFLIYCLQLFLDYLYKTSSQTKVAKLLRHEIDPELVIFGSSVAYVHFDTKMIQDEIKLSTYNMGWDGTFYIQYRGLLEEYLTFTKNCKAIVLVCDLYSFGKNSLITRPDLYYANLNNNHIYNSLFEIEASKIWKAKYIPGFRLSLYNKAFYKEITTNLYYKFRGIPCEDPQLGFRPVDLNWKDVKQKLTPFKAPFDVKIYNSMRETIKKISQKNISVFIVVSPILKESQPLILNFNDHKKFLKSLSNIQNTYFIDYLNDDICNHKELFYNNSHMNKSGAELLTKKFIIDLKRHKYNRRE
jgi:hypothetical protein